MSVVCLNIVDDIPYLVLDGMMMMFALGRHSKYLLRPLGSRCIHQLKLKLLPQSLDEVKAQFPYLVHINVEFRDLDAMKHVNNCTYFQYFENARVHHFTETIMKEFQFTPEGISPVVSDTWCSFRRPVEMYDELVIGLRVENIEQERGEFKHRYIVWSTKQQTVAAQGGSTCVICDFDHDGKRTSIPHDWLKKLEVAPHTEQENS